MGKRTKGQDRDKYYRLAKDQGFRARSAFKLIEVGGCGREVSSSNTRPNRATFCVAGTR